MAAKSGKTTRKKLMVKIIKGFIQVTDDPFVSGGRHKLALSGGEILDPPAEAEAWVKGGLAEWIEVEEAVNG